MKTIKLTVAEAIIKFLDNQYVISDEKTIKYVEGISTIFGHGCVLGLGHALAQDNHSLKVYQGKSEQGMAHTAIAYAKQNNRKKIIPCASSIGPGATNMITAAATATVNNIPLLLFPGDTFSTRQPDPVLQQLEQSYDLSITANDAYRAVVKYFDRIDRPEKLMSALLNAMRVLTDIADTGAVCISLPQDTQGESHEFPKEFFRKRFHRIRRPEAIIEEIDEATRLIVKSQHPLIVCGGGVRYSEAGEELINFSKKHNIPIVETQAGKSVIRSSYELNLGGVGVTGNLAANTIAEKTDLIVGIGTRFSDFTTSSKFLYSGAKVISINASRFHGSKLEAVSVVGDAKVVLRQMDNDMVLSGYKTAYKHEIIEAKALWKEEMNRLSNKRAQDEPEVSIRGEDCIEKFIETFNTSICQTTAISLIRDTIPQDAIIVGASGSLPGDLQRMWETDSIDSYNMEYGFSCMGYEIAGALGSKIAEPKKEVYAMVGDGSYLMLHSEMVTAIQEGYKINILLFDNAGFGCINNLQMGQGIDSLATEFRDREKNFLKIDYAKNASAYGFKTYAVRDINELKNALTLSLKETVSTLIDIKVLPKTMTDGYKSWWNVGCSQIPRNDKQKDALENKIEHLEKARRY